MNLGSFSVRNHVLVNILMFALLVLGLLSLQRMPREQFSEVPFFWITISVPYPGASPEDIERSVTIKIENVMQGLKSLKSVSSVSSEGLSRVRVEFEDGIDADEFARLFQETRTRFSSVELPEGTLEAQLDDFSAADFLPVIEVVLSGNVDYQLLSSSANELEDLLEGIPEVAEITSVGSRERRIHVDVRRASSESLGVSLGEIADTINGVSLSIPAGTASTANREYIVRTQGDTTDVTGISELAIRRDSSGLQGSIRVGDLAGVSEGFEESGIQARFNGRPAIILRVAKVSGGDSAELVSGVREVISRFSRYIAVGIQVDTFGDSTVQIRNSIDVLSSNALFGLFLLTLILFLFVGLRNALITGLGIPVSFAITLIVLELSGQTINTNTLFGLVLVLGLIVDHGIVIVENSYRLQQQGFTRLQAAMSGANQVVGPVIAATGTTVAAFLPLMLLPGTIGRFLRVIPFTVSVALIASTLEALVFLPAHYAEWPGGRKKKAGILAGPLEGLQRSFARMLAFLYKRKKRTLAGALLFLVASFSLVPYIRQDLFSAEDFSLFYIDIEMPVGTPPEGTSDFVARYENRILPLVGNGEITGLATSVGFRSSENANARQGNLAQIIVDLAEQREGRTRPISVIMGEIEALVADIAGAEEVVFRKAVNGPPVSPPVGYRLFGDDYGELGRVAALIRERLMQYPELFNIRDNIEAGTPEMRIVVNSHRAAEYGISSGYVGSYLRSALDGIPAGSYFIRNEEVPVIVRYAPDDGVSDIAAIDEMKIPLPSGGQIPLSSLAVLEEAMPLASIKRLDGKREVNIEASAYDEQNIREINREIREYYNAELNPEYPGVELKVGGEFSDLDDLLLQILRIFLLGIFLMYMILGSQFSSYTQPFLILVTLPFAFAGIITFLTVSGTPFSTTVLYAAVALAGIAVNDSIVLISFINENRKEDVPVMQAVLDAATARMRPILLTSVTTIAGLLPAALGIGGRSVVWAPMASTIIFGLLFSTLTALVVIPLIYGIFYDRPGRMDVLRGSAQRDAETER
ncbi:efflux RND transporter permease subunit [Marispirochaeta aestuarii]|uniref:efflux RND transporter permease subunit n=1 Tax=Marispirochaeta aestuarii TaxID=1963862 RepID=UPI0029C9623D|nr:efflux RND transporter permease subunit [Marispirochaeta aestuarii]